ncbi:hypothetical protein NQ318_022497 [Aromia moschata]|uniref:SLC26A/SulP transporter domain-containing protein n=1 Tax=Aromia moschata TaxID=1265417 RepID=A0AAV8Z4X7_9CUCU|nr:hypothetical protein NQ318_022497 [Aromia moschata]
MLLKPWDYVQRSLPILKWSKEYNADKAICDVVGGITVGLTLIPQVLAYASLAGLDPQYGLYSSLCGGLIYLLFGNIAELTIAPTALLSLLTYSYTKRLSYGNLPGAILLCFLAGCLELLCGILHLGFLVDFVSTPVVGGFTSAGALLIASAQIKNLFGLKYQAEQFVDTWTKFFMHIKEAKMMDTILGLCCCVVLLSMRKLKDYGVPPLAGKGDASKKVPVLKKIIWFVSVARNAVVVISCAAMALILDNAGKKPFSLTTKIPSGWPNVSLPPFSIERGNTTLTFIDMTSELGTGIIVIPFIAIIANVGIAKAFSAMVFLAFTLLTPYFSYIPTPTLAAVIMCAVVFMVEVTMIKKIWSVKRLDLIPFTVTFLSCLLLGLELGILTGILVEALKLLYIMARPKVLVEKKTIQSDKYYIKITPTSSVLFPAAEHVREKILSQIHELGESCQIVVINFHRVNKMDFTAAMVMLSNVI